MPSKLAPRNFPFSWAWYRLTLSCDVNTLEECFSELIDARAPACGYALGCCSVQDGLSLC